MASALDATARVEGLPLRYCGWNTAFALIPSVDDSAPLYYAPPRLAFGFLPLSGAFIEQDAQGRWRLRIEDDPPGAYLPLVLEPRFDLETLGTCVFRPADAT